MTITGLHIKYIIKGFFFLKNRIKKIEKNKVFIGVVNPYVLSFFSVFDNLYAEKIGINKEIHFIYEFI